jgi:LmbE family N-acetylglucosaminyl deacetylase
LNHHAHAVLAEAFRHEGAFTVEHLIQRARLMEFLACGHEISLHLHAKILPVLEGLLQRTKPSAFDETVSAKEVVMAEPLRLLAVFPHPDDESLGMGGTLARYAAEGVETYLLCMTRGERGWAGPAEENPGLEALGRLREGELRCAARHLGLYEVTFLNYIDGDVDRANHEEAIAQIATHIRRIRPQVVVTFSPDGHYGHPDHIAAAQLTGGAIVCAADAGYRDLESQSSFRVSKLYAMVDSKRLVATLAATVGAITMDIDGVTRNHVGWEEWAITTRIDTSAYLDTVLQAIQCHQSQLPGFAAVLELPRETLLTFWGEGAFVRLLSLVNGGRAIERDLFEGLKPQSL